ncbi:MAG TPA: glycosyltransferase family 4 protein [Bacteroidia bacterium]|nr:glycosyltransferase family 4 protein [Bacteroidia bacterium]
MRIALITDGIAPYVLGGMQKHSYYLAKYFAKNKVYVDLVHYNDSNYNIVDLEFFSEEEKKYINSIVLQFPSSPKFPGHYVYKSYKYSCLAFNAIKENLSNYDFIYTKGFSGWKLISEKRKGTISCSKIGIKFHGYEMFQIAPETKAKLQQLILRPFVKKLSKQADMVFSYGGKITDIIKSIGVNPKHIVEIPSGVEKEFIGSVIASHNEPYRKFVFLGRAERRKGIIELKEVLKKLIQEKQNFKFEFIGPIPDSMKINHDSIIYHGEIRDAQKIKSILSQNDVLVCPSWSERFPNVILEAMACGLAIIATDVGAIAAMVSNKNGWLIEPANKEQLEKTILEAINEKKLIEKKEHSLQLVNTTFNWEIIAKKTIEVISSKK